MVSWRPRYARIWEQMTMDISVTAAQPGRRRYLTLVIFYYVGGICCVVSANLAVASMHIQKEFGITKSGNGLCLLALLAPALAFTARFRRDGRRPLYYAGWGQRGGRVSIRLQHGTVKLVRTDGRA